MSKIMHAPEPGPQYWSWRCLRCGEPVPAHASMLERLNDAITRWYDRQSFEILVLVGLSPLILIAVVLIVVAVIFG